MTDAALATTHSLVDRTSQKRADVASPNKRRICATSRGPPGHAVTWTLRSDKPVNGWLGPTQHQPVSVKQLRGPSFLVGGGERRPRAFPTSTCRRAAIIISRVPPSARLELWVLNATWHQNASSNEMHSVCYCCKMITC